MQRSIGRTARHQRAGRTEQQVPKSALSRKPKSNGALGAISEAAEWAEESATDSRSLEEELEAVWAEAGATENDKTSPASGKPKDAASVAALALASANAARKGVLGITCSTPVRERVAQAGGRLQSAELASDKDTAANASPSKPCVANVEEESEEEETSEEEVEMQEVCMIPNLLATNSLPKEAADTVELDIDIMDLQGTKTSTESSTRRPSLAQPERRTARAAAGAGSATSPVRGCIVVGSDVSGKAMHKKSEEPCRSTEASESPKSKQSSAVEAARPVQEGMPHADTEMSTTPGHDPSDAEVEKEWEEIALRTEELAKEARETKGKVAVQQDALSKPISYKEVQSWLADSAPCKDAPRTLEQDFVFKLKATMFDFNDKTHYRMLHTMYSKLARCKVCPRIGSHWEVLGFQGTDPTTDLNRSGGLLNVVHMFFCFSHFFEIYKAAYLLSQDDQQNFPLAAVAINITKMVMDELTAGSLSSIIGSDNKEVLSIVEITCEMFSGGVYHFYSRWRTQKRTIRDSEQTFKEVKAMLRNEPEALLEELGKASRQATTKAEALANVDFTDLQQVDGHEGPLADADPSRLRRYLASEQ